ncbi:MAG: NHL repeat-containing protein [Gemmatimonadota bacterium]
MARSGGLLLVGNAETGTVDVYRAASGKWLRALGGPGAVNDPTDIAVDASAGTVFVLDGRGARVLVFDLASGALVRTISGPGLAASDLQAPTGIAFDPARGEILVSDYGDPAMSVPPAVKLFAPDGTYLTEISGKAGMLGQRFSRPQGLAVDAAGRILLVDALAGEVQVLDRATGSLQATLGGFGSGPGQLWLPLDVAIGLQGRIYVTNNRAGRVDELPAAGAGP